MLVLTACAWLSTVEVVAEEQPLAGHASMSMPAAGQPALAMTALMVTSMMAPLLIEPVRHAVARSLRRRRTRAVLLTSAAHLAAWSAGALLLQATGALILAHADARTAVVVAVAVSAVWHVTPAAQRWANGHHARPCLAAFGPSADLDLVVYGVRHAGSCLGACWPLMLLPAVSGGLAIPVLAGCSSWVWALGLEPPSRPRWRLMWPRRASRLVVRALRSARLHRAGHARGEISVTGH